MLGPLEEEHEHWSFLLTAFTFKGKHFTKTSTRAKGSPVPSCLSH